MAEFRNHRVGYRLDSGGGGFAEQSQRSHIVEFVIASTAA